MTIVVKKIRMRLKNANIYENSIKDSWPISTVGYMIKKQVCTGKLENGKHPARPRSPSVENNQNSIVIVVIE